MIVIKDKRENILGDSGKTFEVTTWKRCRNTNQNEYYISRTEANIYSLNGRFIETDETKEELQEKMSYVRRLTDLLNAVRKRYYKLKDEEELKRLYIFIKNNKGYNVFFYNPAKGEFSKIELKYNKNVEDLIREITGHIGDGAIRILKKKNGKQYVGIALYTENVTKIADFLRSYLKVKR